MTVRAFLVLCCALFNEACTYAISPDVRAAADRSITFQKLSSDPASAAGKTVILGGTIAHSRRDRNATLIEVVQKELDYWGKPRRTDRTGGHFLVRADRPLDPMIYSAGREITVAAEVTGGEEPSLEGTGLYPLLISRELKLWPREGRAWDRAEWLDPLRDPGASPRSGY
jgi:starvation-inducible outer membrane lipoprotein